MPFDHAAVFDKKAPRTIDAGLSTANLSRQRYGARFNAIHASGRAIHASIQARMHILDAMARALGEEPVRHRPAVPYKQLAVPYRRLSVPYTPALRRPAVPRTPAGLPALRTRPQVPLNQRLVLHKPEPMRSPLKIARRPLRERVLYSSLFPRCACALEKCRTRTLTRTTQLGSRRLGPKSPE